MVQIGLLILSCNLSLFLCFFVPLKIVCFPSASSYLQPEKYSIITEFKLFFQLKRKNNLPKAIQRLKLHWPLEFCRASFQCNRNCNIVTMHVMVYTVKPLRERWTNREKKKVSFIVTIIPPINPLDFWWTSVTPFPHDNASLHKLLLIHLKEKNSLKGWWVGGLTSVKLFFYFARFSLNVLHISKIW